MLATASATGCESKKTPPAPPVVVTLTVPDVPAKIVRIDFDGHPIPLIDDRHWKLTLPPRSDVTSMSSRLRVVLPTSCGEEGVEVASVSADGVVSGKWPAQSSIWIDREGVGSSASVSVGAFVVESQSAKVLVGACPTARDIRVGEAIVGQIGSSTIVDAKGGHCYELMTNGFPGARLEGARTYERTFEVFLPNETPPDKTALRRCGSTLVSFASAMGASTTSPTNTFTKPTKPPPKKRPRK